MPETREFIAAHLDNGGAVVNARAYDDGILTTTGYLQASLTASAGKTLLIPPGSYTLTAELAGVSNIEIIAYGVTFTATTRIRSYLNFTNKTNIKIHGLGGDLGHSALATYAGGDYPTIYNALLYFDTCTNVKVIDPSWSNLYTIGVVFVACSDFEVVRPKGTSPTQTQQLQIEHITITSCSRGIIDTPRFVNAAPGSAAAGVASILIAGSTDIRIVDPYAKHAGRDNTGTHRAAGLVDCYGNNTNIKIEGVAEIEDCWAEALRLANAGDVQGAEVKITMADGAETARPAVSLEGTDTYFGVGQSGVNDIGFRKITVIDDYDATRVAVACASQDWGLPATNIEIGHLHVSGVLRPYVVSGPTDGFHIRKLTGSAGTTGQLLAIPGGVTMTTSGGVEADAIFDDITLDDCTLRTTSTTANAIDYNWAKSPEFSGTVGQIAFRRVRVAAAAANSGQAFHCRAPSGGVAGTQVHLIIENCHADNYDIGFYPRVCREVEVRDSSARNWGTGPLVDDSNTRLITKGTRWATGAKSGLATLVAGTVTVTTDEIQSGDRVILVRQTAGGTVGDLRLGTVTADTSFVINSASGSDTSTVYWEIAR